MKTIGRFNATILLGLVLMGCGGAAPQPPPPSGSAPPPSVGASAPAGARKLTIPYTAPSAAFAALWVAADENFFAKYGLQVDVKSMDAVTAGPALMAGEVEYAASPSLVGAILSGSDITFIARLSNYPVFGIYGAQGISRIEDLKGKVIADTTVGSAPDTALRDVLGKHGLKEGDVKLTHVPNPVAVLAAMQSGSAVAGIVPPPVTLQARNAGYTELTTTVKEGVFGLSAPMSTKKARLKDNPAEVRSVLMALKDATAFMHSNAARTKAIIGKYTKTEPGPDLDEVYSAFAAIWEMGPVRAEDIADSLRYSPDPKAGSANPANFFDNSIVEALR